MKRLITLLLTLLLATPVWAAPSTTISIPNSFSANTTIESSKVNDNFNEVQSEYNAHSHSDLTQVGTITSGTWNGTVVGTQYGGTGQNLGTAATGSIIYFDDVGSVSTIGTGSSGQYLRIKSGGTAPAWETAAPEIQDAIVRGLELDYYAADTVSASPGVVYVNTTGVSTTAVVLLDLDIGVNWVSGSSASYAVEDWNWVAVQDTGRFYLMGSDNPPAYSDTDGTTDGTKVYAKYGSTYYRVVGGFKQSGTTIPRDWRQDGDVVMWNVPIQLTTTAYAGSWSGAVSCETGIPITSELGLFSLQGYHPNNPGGISIRPNGSTWDESESLYGIYSNDSPICGQRWSATDKSQQIQYQNDTGDTQTSVAIDGYKMNIR